MTYKENITAILECYFTGFKKEIIDSASERILQQEELKIGLKKTLQKIKYDCIKRDDCGKCKFFSTYGCAVKGIPEYWTIDDISTKLIDHIEEK